MTNDNTIGAAGFKTYSADSYQLGEGLDGDGNLMLIVSFVADGQRIGYRFTPATALELVERIREWGRDHG